MEATPLRRSRRSALASTPSRFGWLLSSVCGQLQHDVDFTVSGTLRSFELMPGDNSTDR
jgi:hypothetical protein